MYVTNNKILSHVQFHKNNTKTDVLYFIAKVKLKKKYTYKSGK